MDKNKGVWCAPSAGLNGRRGSYPAEHVPRLALGRERVPDGIPLTYQVKKTGAGGALLEMAESLRSLGLLLDQGDDLEGQVDSSLETMAKDYDEDETWPLWQTTLHWGVVGNMASDLEAYSCEDLLLGVTVSNFRWYQIRRVITLHEECPALAEFIIQQLAWSPFLIYTFDWLYCDWERNHGEESEQYWEEESEGRITKEEFDRNIPRWLHARYNKKRCPRGPEPYRTLAADLADKLNRYRALGAERVWPCGDVFPCGGLALPGEAFRMQERMLLDAEELYIQAAATDMVWWVTPGNGVNLVEAAIRMFDCMTAWGRLVDRLATVPNLMAAVDGNKNYIQYGGE